MFVSNALEECYRFSSPQYEAAYKLLLEQSKQADYQRNYSAQAAYLLEKSTGDMIFPQHYEHLVENFLKIIRRHVDKFNIRFDIELNEISGLSYGLGLARNVRNHIAHGVFPIIEDPEYTSEFDDPHVKRNIINLLNQASRVAAINIQMLIAICSNGFESEDYEMACMGYDCGELFRKECDFDYLLNLHVEQNFSLNERDRHSSFL